MLVSLMVWSELDVRSFVSLEEKSRPKTAFWWSCFVKTGAMALELWEEDEGREWVLRRERKPPSLV